jgi:hypothetical protein
MCHREATALVCVTSRGENCGRGHCLRLVLRIVLFDDYVPEKENRQLNC